IKTSRYTFNLCCSLSGRSRSIGVLAFGSTREHAFTKEVLDLIGSFAAQVSVAIENQRNHEAAAKYREIARERDRYRLLLELNNAIVSNLELRDLFLAVSRSLKSVIHHAVVAVRCSFQYHHFLRHRVQRKAKQRFSH